MSRDLTSIEDLIDSTENDAAASLHFFTGLLWSEEEQKYILLGFHFKREPTINFYSLRSPDSIEKFAPENSIHPQWRKDFNELQRLVIKDEVIKLLLEKIWKKIHLSILETMTSKTHVKQKSITD